MFKLSMIIITLSTNRHSYYFALNPCVAF